MRGDAISTMIERRYDAVHGARPNLDYPLFRSRLTGGKVSAALGYRRADRERLFLEAYLDGPIEAALADRLGRSFDRHEIVEIGNMASENALAMIGLWAEAANDLGGEAEIAVAVLTAPLRAMFRRLGLSLHEIAPASPERLGAAAADWGQYYRLDPIICAGFIAEGQQCLARMANRRIRACA